LAANHSHQFSKRLGVNCCMTVLSYGNIYHRTLAVL